jgi:hypothetical protein
LKMSLELFPNNEIPFANLFDGRLKRFGITTDAGEKLAALIAPDGNATIVQPTDAGHVQFPDSMPVLVRNAIAAEFALDLLKHGEGTHVVIERPSCGDAEFISRWLDAASASDHLLQQHYKDNPEFRKEIFRLEVMYCVEFAPAATAFIRNWLKDRRSFSLSLRDSVWAEIFTVMVGIGFFTRTGVRYQMTVPEPLNLESITESLLQLVQTEDAEYYLHPERHLVTMTAYQAKSLRKCLRRSDEETRLADREKALTLQSA